MEKAQAVGERILSAYSASPREASWWKWRGQMGFTLMEVLASIGVGMLVMSIGAYTYWAISRQDRSHLAVEREVHRLRDDLVQAHLQAQRGLTNAVKLNLYDLVVVPKAGTALPYVGFMAPDGALNPACLGGQPRLEFRVGKNQTWYRFIVEKDGMFHCERSVKPDILPGEPINRPPGLPKPRVRF